MDEHLNSAAKLTEWEKEPGVEDLKKDLLMAQESHDTQVQQIKNWLRLRDAKRTKEKKANRSQVQSKLIRRQAEWRYSALTEPFLSSDRMFTITPRTFEDAQSARQNETLLNWQFRTKLNRVKFIDDYVRTATDEGTVIVRPGWIRRTEIVEVEEVVYSFYPVQAQEQLDALNQAIELHQTHPDSFNELPEELQEAALYTMETGTPVIAVPTGTQMVEEERVVKNQPTLDILEFDNVYIDPNCGGDLDKANFAIISFETSQAELEADGRYQNLDKVEWASHQPIHEPNHTSRSNTFMQFDDDLRKRVVAYEYWGFYNVRGDGILRPIVATWVGSTMIRMEENPYPDQKIPLVVAQYMPVKKSVAGEPDAVLLEDNQDIQGALMRGMIDLMGRSANGQTGFAKGMLDVVNRRRFDQGLDYEFNPSATPQMGIHQHTYPEIPASAMNMLALQNQEAEALTGVKSFSGGLSGNAYGDVAAGVRGMLDAASKREMAILRRLAKGLEDIGRKIMAMNAIFLSEEEVIQVTNEVFVTVKREELAGECDLEVDIATAEIDEAQAQDLGFMLQTLGNSMPFEITKRILAKIAKLKRLPDLAEQIESYEPQPDPLEQRKKELELAQLEADIAEQQARVALAQAKTQEALAKARALGSEADLKDLDFIEQETGTKHMRELDKQSAQARGNQMLEITKRVLEPADGDGQGVDVAQAMKVRNAAALLT